MGEFQYQEIFEHAKDTTAYRKLTADYVSTTDFEGKEVLKVQPEALTLLAREAMDDVAHLLRSSHLKQLAKILDNLGSLLDLILIFPRRFPSYGSTAAFGV